MPVKSEPADTKARLGVPRWIFEAWLWASTLAVFLESLGCPEGRLFETCVRVGNAASIAFDLFPGVLAIGLYKLVGSVPLVLATVVACTIACQVLVRRFLPVRLSPVAAAAFVAIWFVLSFIVEGFSFWLAFGRFGNFFTFLWGAIAELFGRSG
jgi:hypothetical protein